MVQSSSNASPAAGVGGGELILNMIHVAVSWYMPAN